MYVCIIERVFSIISGEIFGEILDYYWGLMESCHYYVISLTSPWKITNWKKVSISRIRSGRMLLLSRRTGCEQHKHTRDRSGTKNICIVKQQTH